MSLPANMRGTASLPATVRSAAAFRKMASLNASTAEDSLGAATRTIRYDAETSHASERCIPVSIMLIVSRRVIV